MNKVFSNMPFGGHFIPFSAHINPQTIISKSGFISQTVRILPNSFVKFQSDIQNAIAEIISDTTMVNIHGIYFEKEASVEESLQNYLQSVQSQLLFANKNFAHEFYITISIPAYDINKKTFGHFVLRNKFLMELEHATQKLQSVVQKFCKKVERYKPNILSAFIQSEVAYSKNNAFLYKLLFMEDARIPLADIETSQQIQPTKITIKKNYLAMQKDDKKKLVACLTIKNFAMADQHKLVSLFTVPCPFVIGQGMHKSGDIKNLFQYQFEKAIILKGNQIPNITGWNEMIQEKSPIAMQTNITVYGGDAKELEQNVKIITQKLAEIGLVFMREDINLEQTFYASLPVNHSFLNRLDYTSPRHIGQFMLSKNMLFYGIEEIQHLPFLPLCATNGKYYALSPIELHTVKHTIVHGKPGDKKHIAINSLLMNIAKGVKVVVLEDGYSSIPVNVLMHGKHYKAPQFNMLALLRYSKKDFLTFFTKLVGLFMKKFNITETDAIKVEIRNFFTQLTPKTTLQDLPKLSNHKVIHGLLKFAKGVGFLEKEDAIANVTSFVSINVTGLSGEVYSIVALYTMLCAKHSIKDRGILKIDSTFETFYKSIIPEKLLLTIMDELQANRVCFFAMCSLPEKFEKDRTFKYADVFTKFDIMIFFESECSTQFVKQFFQINSATAKHLMFIKAGMEKFVVKNQNTVYTVKIAESIPVEDLAFLNVNDVAFKQTVDIMRQDASQVVSYYDNLIKD